MGRRQRAVRVARRGAFRVCLAAHRRPVRVVSKLVLRGGQAHLEIGGDGLHNWRLRQPQDRGPGHYWFQALEAHDASVSFAHPAVGLQFRAAASDVADVDEAWLVVVASASASRIHVCIVAGGTQRRRTDDAHRLRRPDARHRLQGRRADRPGADVPRHRRWFGLRGHAEVAGARPRCRWPRRRPLPAAQDRRRRDARRRFARRAARVGRWARTGRRCRAAFARPRHVAAPTATAMRSKARRRASARATSRASWRGRASGDRSTVRARLTSESTSAADVLWLAGRSAAPDRIGVRIGTERPRHRPRSFAPVRELDADVAVEIRHLHAAPFRACRACEARSPPRRPTARDLRPRHRLGRRPFHRQCRARLPAPRCRSTSNSRPPACGSSRCCRRRRQEAHHRRARRARGAEGGRQRPRAMRTSATGHAAFALRGGTISSLLDAELGLEAGKMVRTLLSGAEALPLPCAAPVVDLAQRPRRAAQPGHRQRQHAHRPAAATSTCATRAIDVVLTPEPKRPGIDLGRSIRLHGRAAEAARSRWSTASRSRRAAPGRGEAAAN